MAQAGEPNYLIAGLGKTGWSCVRFLRGLGASVAVTDNRPEPPLANSLSVEHPEVRTAFGKLDSALLTHAHTVVASPGLSQSKPFFTAAREQGIPIIGDIELFSRVANKPVAAVTGSNGKSTVTRLLAEMASASGLCAPAGANLGTPALDLLKDDADLYLLELSSFQLELAETLSPTAAVVLNVSADHMDRHPSLEQYAAIKARVYEGADVAVINEEDSLVRAMGGDVPRRITFGAGVPQADTAYGLRAQDGEIWLARGDRALLPAGSLAMQGRHNRLNALAALAMGEALGLPESTGLDVVQDFRGLPHRCQRVAERRGVTYINDSKATNVGAALASLEGLSGRVVWLAGGQSKAADFAPLRRALQGKARAIVLLGEDAGVIGKALGDVADIHYARDLEEAVAQAASLACGGDTVLFSPACASFDMFTGFAERGECFETTVRGLDPCVA